MCSVLSGSTICTSVGCWLFAYTEMQLKFLQLSHKHAWVHVITSQCSKYACCPTIVHTVFIMASSVHTRLVYVHSGRWYLVKHILVLAVDPGHNSHPTDHLPDKGATGQEEGMKWLTMVYCCCLTWCKGQPFNLWERESKPRVSGYSHVLVAPWIQ